MKALDRFIQSWRIRRIRPFLNSGARVLDVGTSDGALFRQIPKLGPSIGIDPDLEPHATGPNTQFIKWLFPADLPETEPFDAITMLAVLEHIPPDIQPILARDCFAHLQPGGLLLITVPAPAVDYILAGLRFFRLIDGMSLEQHYGFEPSMTQELFESAGFRLKRHATFQLGLNHLFVFEKPV